MTTFANFSPKDFIRLCSLFVETELMHRWFPGGIMKPATVLSWHSKYAKVIQLRVSLGIPLISDRDAIVSGNGYHLPDRNALLISSKPIAGDRCRHCVIPPPDRGVVRMTTESIFYVQLEGLDRVAFKMIGRDDLKLRRVPPFLLNYLAQGHLPFDLMRTVQRTIRNFGGSAWEAKIRERGAYYAEIEDTVREQLEKWDEDGHGKSGATKEGEIFNSPANDEGSNDSILAAGDTSQLRTGRPTALKTAACLPLLVAVLCLVLYPEAMTSGAIPVLLDLPSFPRANKLVFASSTAALLLLIAMLISLLARGKLRNELTYGRSNTHAVCRTRERNKPQTLTGSCASADEKAKDADRPKEINTSNLMAAETKTENSTKLVKADGKSRTGSGHDNCRSLNETKNAKQQPNQEYITNIQQVTKDRNTSLTHKEQAGGRPAPKPKKLRNIRRRIKHAIPLPVLSAKENTGR